MNKTAYYVGFRRQQDMEDLKERIELLEKRATSLEEQNESINDELKKKTGILDDLELEMEDICDVMSNLNNELDNNYKWYTKRAKQEDTHKQQTEKRLNSMEKCIQLLLIIVLIGYVAGIGALLMR